MSTKSVSIAGVEWTDAAYLVGMEVFSFTVPADRILTVLEFNIGQESDASDAETEQYRCELRRLTGTFTPGGAPAGSTAVSVDLQDSAAGGDTFRVVASPGTSSGSNQRLWVDAQNNHVGFEFIPAVAARPKFLEGETLQILLPRTSGDGIPITPYPATSTTLNATLQYLLVEAVTGGGGAIGTDGIVAVSTATEIFNGVTGIVPWGFTRVGQLICQVRSDSTSDAMVFIPGVTGTDRLNDDHWQRIQVGHEAYFTSRNASITQCWVQGADGGTTDIHIGPTNVQRNGDSN